MLSKLLKYEVKATARIFLPLMAVLLVFAGINRLISELSNKSMQAPQVISMILYVTILIGVFIMTLVVMIQRFYKNLLTDEGYLMFTLPVKAWQHIVSKLVISLMWTVICSITAIMSVLIIASDDIITPQAMKSFIDGISEFLNYFGPSAVLVVIEIILSILVSIIANVLLIYASIAVGHLVSRHRILTAIGAFIALNTVSQIVLTIIGSSVAVASFGFDFNATNADEMSMVLNSMHTLMWFTIIFSAMFAAGYFALTNVILKKRLNLE